MRTEDDSWDVTTSVGSTGLLVAAARVLETQKADPLAIDPYAEVFCRAAGGEWADVLDGKLPDHYLTTGDFGEHFVNFQGARTRYFDEYFSRATAAGMKQVVILAAGLDSRAFRLQWPIGTTIFELDRPQVLDFKNAVLADYHIRPRAQRRSAAASAHRAAPKTISLGGNEHRCERPVSRMGQVSSPNCSVLIGFAAPRRCCDDVIAVVRHVSCSSTQFITAFLPTSTSTMRSCGAKIIRQHAQSASPGVVYLR